MIGATLQFARDEARRKPRRPTDLTALLQSIVDDMGDAGLPVTMEPAEPVVYECRPDALKRALPNLIDNAVKYGKRAQRRDHARRRGRSRSPSTTKAREFPKQELTRVFEPFYRVEGSRSRETGGVGLGLAIALSIVQAHGGELRLTNRADGRFAGVNHVAPIRKGRK